MRDLYDILGVAPDADADAIKRAYRRRARELHPDSGGDEEAFKELTTAYEVLSDPGARANYDRFGDPRGPQGAAGGGSPFSDLGDVEDLFEAFFGGGRRRSTRRRRSGRDAVVEVHVGLEDVATGVTQPVRVTLPRACDDCGGSGAAPGSEPVACRGCGGSGAVQQVTRSLLGQVMTTGPCPTCDGEGREVPDPCAGCAGRGAREVTEELEVDVPPGVDDGTRLRLRGRGEAGRRGAPAGDLYVRVRVAPHEVFVRDGDDLHAEVTVPMTQAALGCRLQVPTLDGEQELRLAPGTQSGEVLTLRRAGLPRLGGGSQRGDLRVHVAVATPTDLDAEQERLLRELAERRDEPVGDDGARGLLRRLREALR